MLCSSCCPSVPFPYWTCTHLSGSIWIPPPSLRLFSFPPSPYPMSLLISPSLNNIALHFNLIVSIAGLALELYGIYTQTLDWNYLMARTGFHSSLYSHRTCWAHNRCQIDHCWIFIWIYWDDMVYKTIQVSCVQLSKISAHYIMHPLPQAVSLHIHFSLLPLPTSTYPTPFPSGIYPNKSKTWIRIHVLLQGYLQ